MYLRAQISPKSVSNSFENRTSKGTKKEDRKVFLFSYLCVTYPPNPLSVKGALIVGVLHSFCPQGARILDTPPFQGGWEGVNNMSTRLPTASSAVEPLRGYEKGRSKGLPFFVPVCYLSPKPPFCKGGLIYRCIAFFLPSGSENKTKKAVQQGDFCVTLALKMLIYAE